MDVTPPLDGNTQQIINWVLGIAISALVALFALFRASMSDAKRECRQDYESAKKEISALHDEIRTTHKEAITRLVSALEHNSDVIERATSAIGRNEELIKLLHSK